MTRHPYSFRGGARADDGTWSWRDGLCVYVGDMVGRALADAGVPPADVEALRAPGGLARALADRRYDRALQTLELASASFGRPLTRDVLRRAAERYEHEPVVSAKGRTIGELDRLGGESAVAGLAQLGSSVDVPFDFDVQFEWHPVDSQRFLFYAGRSGKQEAFVTALAKRHFEGRQAAGARDTVLDAAADVGFDRSAAAAFLDGDEHRDDVWRSYAETVGKHGVHSIPFFVFNGPSTAGGTFRRGACQGEYAVRGSASAQEFLTIFEGILRAETRPKRAPRPRRRR